MSFGLDRILGRVKGLVFAALTFAGISLVLVVPAVVGASTQLVLHIAAFLVGTQAAQSSVIQVGRNLDSSILGKRWLLVACATLLTILEVVINPNPVASTIFATISGSLVGLVLGQSSLLVLTGKGGTAFQSFQALRSMGIVIAAAISGISEGLTFNYSPLVMTILVAALTYYQPRVGRRRMGYAEPGRLSSGAAVSVALGLMASLYYRNDVNWVRTVVSASQDFIIWHYSLVIYGAVQGLVGFLIVQVIFADRQRWRIRIAKLVQRYMLIGLFGWLAIVSGAVTFAPLLPVIPSVLGCSILAALVGFISGFAHVLELNWAPYIAGIFGATALSLLLVVGIDPRLAMVLESSVIGSITIVLILIQRRRACSFYN